MTPAYKLTLPVNSDPSHDGADSKTIVVSLNTADKLHVDMVLVLIITSNEVDEALDILKVAGRRWARLRKIVVSGTMYVGAYLEVGVFCEPV